MPDRLRRSERSSTFIRATFAAIVDAGFDVVGIGSFPVWVLGALVVAIGCGGKTPASTDGGREGGGRVCTAQGTVRDAPDGGTADSTPRALSFLTTVNYECAGVQPRVVATGDLDGDGIPDLALAAMGAPGTGGALCVSLNNGDGTFAAPVVQAVGAGPIAVAIADLNGDRRQDVVVANEGSVSVLLNQGLGSLAAAVDYSTHGESPSSLAIGDLNGDGQPDLAVADAGSGNVSVFLNQGGTFAAPDAYATDGPLPHLGSAYALAVGDVDGDGRMDLAVTSGEPRFGVLLNEDGGGFTFPKYTSMSTYASAVALSDLNRDGQVDLVVLTLRSVNIFLNTGGGTLTSAASYALPGDLFAMALGDLNGDSVPDLAVTSREGTVAVMFNRRNGAFLAPAYYATGAETSAVASGDLNADGVSDLVVTTKAGVAVLLNDGRGAFGPSSYAAMAGGNVAAGDLNGDGMPDLVVTHESGSMISVVLNKGDGAFTRLTTYTAGDAPAAAVIGDLDGDCQPDIAVANHQSRDVAMLLNDGRGVFFSRRSEPLPEYGPFSIAAADLNGDGRLDLALMGFHAVHVLLNLGGGAFAPSLDYPVDGGALTLGDVNGDGVADLALTVVNGSVGIYINDGDGHFGPSAEYPAGTHPALIALGDLNGDGAADLVTGSANTAEVDVLFNDGHGTFAAAVSYAIEPTPSNLSGLSYGPVTRSIALGDLNADGKLDVAVVSAVSEEIFTLLNDGTGTLLPPVNHAAGPTPESIALEDVNDDGLTDMVASNLDGRISVLLNTSR